MKIENLDSISEKDTIDLRIEKELNQTGPLTQDSNLSVNLETRNQTIVPSFSNDLQPKRYKSPDYLKNLEIISNRQKMEINKFEARAKSTSNIGKRNTSQTIMPTIKKGPRFKN